MNRLFSSAKRVISMAALLFLAAVVFLPVALAAGSATYLQQALIDGRTVQRWNDSTRVIVIAMQSGQKVPGWSPRMMGIAKSAFSDWQKALGGRIRFEYTQDVSQADAILRWSRQDNGQQVGHQTIQWANNTLTDAEINIALQNARGQRLTDNELKYVALHEIGHLLGIRGHSPHPEDIMFASMQPRVSHLSGRDIATIRALYRLKPEITNPTGIHLLQYKHFLYYVQLGYTAHRQKNYANAYEYFLKARGYYPSDPKIGYLLGMSAYSLKRYDESIRYLKPLAAEPGEQQNHALYYLAGAYMSQAAAAFESGKTQAGKEKLGLARQYYGQLAKNPTSPTDLRQLATSNLTKIDQFAGRIR